MNSNAVSLRRYVGAFVDELSRSGVSDVCICPGSRSTPLAMLFREHPNIRVWMHLDERSAAFFALGIGKTLRRPAAVVCTSGTAAANFMPAVVEARYAGVPLLALTADRPAELRGIGANQTIDQVRIYGSHAKWSEEMLLPEATDEAVRHARSMAARAVAETMGAQPGPVHVNFPFREPLIPAPPSGGFQTLAEGGAQVAVSWPRRVADEGLIRRLAGELAGRVRGLIVCGPMDEPGFPSAVSGLAGRLGWPVLADVLSQTRCGPGTKTHVLDSYDAFLRDEDIACQLAPEVVLRFGAAPTSKPLLQFLERHSEALQIVVSDGSWADPARTADEFVFASPVAFSEALSVALLPAPASSDGQQWLALWRQANDRASRALAQALDLAERMTEPSTVRRLSRLLPEGSVVFAGNSMPVRDLDSFFPADDRRLRFLANRGASGIDGVVSTALGVAAVSADPVVILVGDLSFYHDMNGLFAVKRHGLKATIVLVNNDGGGIFSFLPQAANGDHFEELFGTPHGLEFRHAADMYGLDYTLAATPNDFDAAVTRSLGSPGVGLIEVRTDRQENLALHRKLWALAVGAASGT